VNRVHLRLEDELSQAEEPVATGVAVQSVELKNVEVRIAWSTVSKKPSFVRVSTLFVILPLTSRQTVKQFRGYHHH
jgi:hypothetical protein